MIRMQQDLTALMGYWHTPVGRSTWQRESMALSRLVSHSTTRMLEVGLGASLKGTFAPLQHVRWAGSFDDQLSLGAHYIADGRAQPFDDCTFDTVLVHHLLDCVPSPHHWLSEAARVTADHGRLYLVGWNAWQPRWPWARYASPARRRIFIRQIRDWLAFVDLEIERVHYCAFSTSRSRYGQLAEQCGKALDLPLGGSYIVVARRERQYIVSQASRQRRQRLLNVGRLQSGLLAPLPRDRARDVGPH